MPPKTLRKDGLEGLRQSRQEFEDLLTNTIDEVNSKKLMQQPCDAEGNYKVIDLQIAVSQLKQLLDSLSESQDSVLGAIEAMGKTNGESEPEIQVKVAEERSIIRPLMNKALLMHSTLKGHLETGKEQASAMKISKAEREDSYKLKLAAQQEQIKIDQKVALEKIALDKEKLALDKEKLVLEKEQSQRAHDLALKQLEQNAARDQLVVQTGGTLSNVATGQDTNVRERHHPKPPPITVPSFSGDQVNWIEFDSLFCAIIDSNPSLSDVEKFQHLKTLVKDDAARVINSFQLKAENYKPAYEKLKRRYGNDQDITETYFRKIATLEPPDDSYADLCDFYDTVEGCLQALEAKGIDVNTQCITLCTTIRDLLPKSVVLELNRMKGRSPWSLSAIREHLDLYLEQLKSVEVVTSSPKSKSRTDSSKKSEIRSPQYSSVSPKPKVTSSQALVGTTETGSVCIFCDKKGHAADDCSLYPDLFLRHSRLYEKGRCFKCLQTWSNSHRCSGDLICSQCGKSGHLGPVCRKAFPQKPSFQGRRNSEKRSLNSQNKSKGTASSPKKSEGDESKKNSNCSSETKKKESEKALTAVGNSPSATQRKIVHLQTATTVVKNPVAPSNKSQVRLIIDGGSDRTYISKSVANSLACKPIKTDFLAIHKLHQHKKPDVIESPVVEVEIQLKDKSFLKIQANVISPIVCRVPRYPLNLSKWGKFLPPMAELADDLPHQKNFNTVDLLIGGDFAEEILLSGRTAISNSGLYLRKSRLGFLISGACESEVEGVKQARNYFCVSEFSPQIEYSCSLLTYTSLEIPALQQFSDPDPSFRSMPDLSDWWSLEKIGISESPSLSDDDLALQKFNNTVQYDGTRYQVTWPWKDENPEVPDNKALALGRFRSSLRRLSDPDIRGKLDAIILDQEARGIIEKVFEPPKDGNLVHYLAHQAVITPQKETTKVRMVFDGSAKQGKKSPSINDLLLRGQVILPDLCGLLLRFRFPPTVILADIEKAFLQVGLQPSQRDITRFFWFKDASKCTLEDNLQVYRFARVPFGMISSPFLLGATVKYHLRQSDSQLAQEILSNTYVDNVVIGVLDTKAGLKAYVESKALLQTAGMNLREYVSNDSELMALIPEEDRAKGEVVKVFGLRWELASDSIFVSGASDFPTEVKTKREMLHAVAKVFDPLGLFTPALLPLKMLIQECWKLGLKWDETIPPELSARWQEISLQIHLLSKHKFPRQVSHSLGIANLKYELCCFTDASQLAYASVIYLKVTDLSSQRSAISLLFSKSRLAPVNKDITIPRLELLGVLIGLRSLRFLSLELKVPIHKLVLWTDSSCVLDWLCTTKPQPVFVERRLLECRGLISDLHVSVRYIPTSENPADIASRGMKVEELLKSDLWLQGPGFLQKNSSEWPILKRPEISSTVLGSLESENEGPIFQSISNLALGEGQQDAEKPTGPLNKKAETYSSLQKLLRSTAWVIKFIDWLRAKDKNSVPKGLSVSDINRARYLWDLTVQQRHFSHFFNPHGASVKNFVRQLGLRVDEKGLLRCVGRLENSELTEGAKAPILLPKKDPYTRLCVLDSHERCLHSGIPQTLCQLRKRYWVIKGRSLVRTVLLHCNICRRVEGPPYKPPPMPPLPSSRVSRTVPFHYTGVDYFGPIMVRNKKDNSQSKVWGCLFTCLSTRAVHLELVEDMTAETFLNCLRRFIARRGKPKMLYSDNAKQFILTEKMLHAHWLGLGVDPSVQSYLSNEGISWKFIVELAPWMGGFYERLVQIVKRSLKKTLRNNLVTNDHLTTVLSEIEATVNSRPLVYVGDKVDDQIALTPLHLIMPNSFAGTPELEPLEPDQDADYVPRINSEKKLFNFWRRNQELLNQFWKIWHETYLHSLRERYQSILKSHRNALTIEPKVGTVVLIGQENLPRGQWRLGRISELISSEDGQIRHAKILMTDGKTFKRSVSQLYPLEFCEEDQGPEPLAATNGNVDNNSLLDVPLDLDIPQRRILPARHAREEAQKRITGTVDN